MNTDTATLNLCEQDSMLLQTAEARVETPVDKRSKYLRILFDTGSKISFITTRAEGFLNLVTKRSKQFKSFGNNQMKQELENLEIIIKTLNHEKILANTFVSDICSPIYSRTLNFCRQKHRHISNLNFAESNAESKAHDLDILIG